MAGTLTSEQAKELAAKGVAARQAKALAKLESPVILDRDRDDDIVWAYANFNCDPSKAPTDSKAFWLTIAQRDPAKFYKDHFLTAHQHQCEYQRDRLEREQRLRDNPNYEEEQREARESEAVKKAEEEAYNWGYTEAIEGWPHFYEDYDAWEKRYDEEKAKDEVVES